MPSTGREAFLRRTPLCVVFLVITILCGCGNGSNPTSSASAGPCAPLPPAADPSFLVHLTPFMNDLCYQKQNWQHDAQVRTSDGVHPFVRVWYSPPLFDWITVKNRTGPVPNGAMVVKEQFQSLTAPLSEWTVMVKDSKLSWDGWYWADLVNPTPRNPNATPTPSPGRRMCRAAGPVQRRGIVLPELPCVGDRQFGDLFEYRLPESDERRFRHA